MDRIADLLVIITILFFASINFHTYIRKTWHEEHGWISLWAAITATISVTGLWLKL